MKSFQSFLLIALLSLSATTGFTQKLKLNPNYEMYQSELFRWEIALVQSLVYPSAEGDYSFVKTGESFGHWTVTGPDLNGTLTFSRTEADGINWTFEGKGKQARILVSPYWNDCNDPRELALYHGTEAPVYHIANNEPDCNSWFSIHEHDPDPENQDYEYRDGGVLFMNNLKPCDDGKWEVEGDGTVSSRDQALCAFAIVNLSNVRLCEDLPFD